MPDLDNTYKISREETLIKLSHENIKLTFACKLYGPGNYFDIQKAIKKDRLSTPTMAQIASLLYCVYSAKQIEPEFSFIKNKLERILLFAFTGVLHMPKKGVYMQDNPKIKNGVLLMDEQSLIKKLDANDINVRFVSSGFETGEVKTSSLAKNPYIIGLAGNEDAEKLAETASMLKGSPILRLYDQDEGDGKTARISALCCPHPCSKGLVIFECNHDYRHGYSFGIHK